MNSKYIVFPDKHQVDVWEEEIVPPEADEILCAADKSLISTGTELHCLNGIFDPGTNWHDWGKYPSAALAPCTQLVRRMGRLVLLGDTPTPSLQHLGPSVLFKSIAILGLDGYAVPDRTTEFTPPGPSRP